MRHALLLLVGCASAEPPLCSECDPAAHYCVEYHSDLDTIPSTSECRTFQPPCDADRSCACLEQNGIAEDISCVLLDACEVNEDGLVVEICPGGG